MIKLPTKEELRNIIIEKKKLVIISVLLLVTGVLGVFIFTGVINTPLTDPLTSFQAPTYIPEGYVSMGNNSTHGVDKSYTYANEGNGNYFVVAAVKDLNQSEYGELTDDQISEEMEGTKTVNEEMVVNGHPVNFKMISMDFMGMSMNMFQATWLCPETGLHIIATGKINNNEKENIKKMVQSIQCHTPKKSFFWEN